jgi:CHAD domain-containing protein
VLFASSSDANRTGNDASDRIATIRCETGPMKGPGEASAGSVVFGRSDRDQPAGRVFALVLEGAFEEFRRLEPDVLLGEDPEALHDYRVVLRRTRCVLAAGSSVYPPEELDLLRALTARFVAVTSPVRDLDVLLAVFDDYAEGLSAELLGGATALRSELRRLRDEAHDELVSLIRGDSHPVLLRRWQVMSSVHRLGGSEPGPDALRPTGEISDQLLLRSHRRLVRSGRSLIASEEPDDWHRLRRRLKRFRDLVSIFAPVYRDGAFDELLADLSGLQDRLGVLHDHVVHASKLEQVGVRLGDRSALAAGALADELHHRVRKDLRRARKRWRRFDDDEVARAVRRAVKRG